MSASRLSAVNDRIAMAAQQAGRLLSDVQLIAVSKTFSAEEILPVLDAGQRRFGENRVQEAQGKWPTLTSRFSDVELHLIGPLQTNKAVDAVALFDVIHTLDRPKLAGALAQALTKTAQHIRCFVQVNTGAEPQKAGIAVADTTSFVEHCIRDHGLTIEGLMCIPPIDDDPRSHFRLLADLAKQLSLKSLSMGMSGDYPIAIGEGATHIRVGSAIFGSR
jgi:PLP dependent protein